MRRLCINILAGCLYYSGLMRILLLLGRMRSKPVLMVLTYHRAFDMHGNLRKHLLFLRRYCRVLPLEQALEELYAPCAKKRTRDRRMPVAITFDDGHRDNYTYGFTLAQELQMSFAIFLPSGYIESGKNYWWQEGKQLVRNAQVDKIILKGRIYYLHEPEDQNALIEAIYAHLRGASSVTAREAFLKNLRATLEPSPASEEDLLLPLTWEQICEMDRSGLATFGAHTVHHPILSCLEDPTEVQREVKECREILEQKLGHPVRTFAYPVGKADDIGMYALQAVKNAGYDWAFTTVRGVNTSQSNPHQLLRVSVDVSQHWLFLTLLVSGLWLFISQSWNKAAFSLQPLKHG